LELYPAGLSINDLFTV